MLEKIPHIYYYVPPCPECGSRKTGRYVRKPLTSADAWYVETQSLQNGELIRFAKNVPFENAYCEDCGNKWHVLVRACLKTAAEIQDEIEVRGSKEQYEQYIAENPKKKKSFMGKICGLLP